VSTTIDVIPSAGDEIALLCRFGGQLNLRPADPVAARVRAPSTSIIYADIAVLRRSRILSSDQEKMPCVGVGDGIFSFPTCLFAARPVIAEKTALTCAP
jgi:hypothetical protein